MELPNLLELSKPGIWGFFNDKDKRFFISHSNNILTAVSRNLAQIQDKSHSCRQLIRDLSHLNLVLLVSNDDMQYSRNRKIITNQLKTAYKTKGYTPYNDSTVVSYKLRTVITKDYKIHVLLVNKRNDKIVIGVFDNVSDSTSFIQSNYPNNQINKVIYSKNSLTKEFYNSGKDILV